MKPHTSAKSYNSIADEFLKLIWIWVLLVYHNHPHLSCLWMLHCVPYFSMQPIALEHWVVFQKYSFLPSYQCQLSCTLILPMCSIKLGLMPGTVSCPLIGWWTCNEGLWLAESPGLMTQHRMLSISAQCMQYAASNVNNALTTLPSYPEEPIYSELVFQSPPGAPGHPRPSGDMSREPPFPVREKPPYPSPPSYKSHPCYNGMAGPLRHPMSEPVTSDIRRDPGGGVTHTSSPDSGHHPHEGHGDIVFYDWDAVNMNSRLQHQHRPDLSSDSDYFSTSTYRDNYKGN